jgi:hypothetical protein
MLDVAWSFVEEELARRLADLSLTCDRYLIVESGAPPYYVQYFFEDDGSIYNEAVSNRYLEGSHRLDVGQEAKLLAFGWLPPGSGDATCDCHDFPPNHHRTWQPFQGWRVIAQVAIVTFRCVYGIRSSESFAMKEVPY